MDKGERLNQLLPNGRGVWIPIDHGASDYPTEGLEDPETLIRDLIEAGVDAIVAQKGLVSAFAHLCDGTSTNMVVHYSVSTRHAGPRPLRTGARVKGGRQTCPIGLGTFSPFPWELSFKMGEQKKRRKRFHLNKSYQD